MKTKILIVEDRFIEANNLRIILRKAGYLVTGIASSVPEAIRLIEEERPDLVMLDIYLETHLTGIDLAGILKKMNIAFVFLSANSDKRTLDAAKLTQPYGFLVKPFRQKDVLVMLDVALYLHNEATTKKRNPVSSSPGMTPNDFHPRMIGESAVMLNVMENVRIVGQSETSVLILGESGTGKELIAQCIHNSSPRKTKPIVVVNCGALPANLIESELFGHEKGSFTGATDKRIGKFEQAEGGTIFLDEIGELPLDLQVKFLRVLQEKEIESIGGKKKKINVRVIAATNRNLEEEMASGRFRLDLYYRLNVFPIVLPPLRERKQDIPLLANHFLQLYAARENKIILGLTDSVISQLTEYPWPGNIRELDNLMARTALLSPGGIVNSVQLPSSVKTEIPAAAGSDSPLKPMAEYERDYILNALIKCNWKIFGAGGVAEILGMNASTLRSRMKKLGIEKSTFLKGLHK
ncbi:MAG: sigma-54 dependent transcriptional regulator [Chitinophagaceae bacterium]